MEEGNNEISIKRNEVAEEDRIYKEVSHSMQRRCEGWDYKGRGIYMLTLVVRDRQPLLCTIEEDGNGVHTELTEVGRAVIEETGRICEIYPQIRVLMQADHARPPALAAVCGRGAAGAFDIRR